jgi:hypothetical protein
MKRLVPTSHYIYISVMTDRREFRTALSAWMDAEDGYQREMNKHLRICWGNDSGDQEFEKLTDESFSSLAQWRKAADTALASYQRLVVG